jgi:hypothetical protein
LNFPLKALVSSDETGVAVFFVETNICRGDLGFFGVDEFFDVVVRDVIVKEICGVTLCPHDASVVEDLVEKIVQEMLVGGDAVPHDHDTGRDGTCTKRIYMDSHRTLARRRRSIVRNMFIGSGSGLGGGICVSGWVTNLELLNVVVDDFFPGDFRMYHEGLHVE